jgi:hypothetical protein
MSAVTFEGAPEYSLAKEGSHIQILHALNTVFQGRLIVYYGPEVLLAMTSKGVVGCDSPVLLGVEVVCLVCGVVAVTVNFVLQSLQGPYLYVLVAGKK